MRVMRQYIRSQCIRHTQGGATMKSVIFYEQYVLIKRHERIGQVPLMKPEGESGEAESRVPSPAMSSRVIPM